MGFKDFSFFQWRKKLYKWNGSNPKSQGIPVDYVTATIAMGLAVDHVERGVGDYHSNLWDDDFIQSLSTPYEVFILPFLIFLLSFFVVVIYFICSLE